MTNYTLKYEEPISEIKLSKHLEPLREGLTLLKTFDGIHTRMVQIGEDIVIAPKLERGSTFSAQHYLSSAILYSRGDLLAGDQFLPVLQEMANLEVLGAILHHEAEEVTSISLIFKPCTQLNPEGLTIVNIGKEVDIEKVQAIDTQHPLVGSFGVVHRNTFYDLGEELTLEALK